MSGDSRVGRLARHGLLLLTSSVLALPFFWLVLTTFKSEEELFADRLWPSWPPRVTASPYVAPDGTERRFRLAPVLLEDAGGMLLHAVPPGAFRPAAGISLAAGPPRAADHLATVHYAWGDATTLTLATPLPPSSARPERVKAKLAADGSYHYFRWVLTASGEEWRGPWERFDHARMREWVGVAPGVRPGPGEVRFQRADPSPRDSSDGLRLELRRTSALSAFWAKVTGNYRLGLKSLTLANVPVSRFFLNSALLVLFNILGNLLACTLTAYAFSRFRWPGRDAAFGLLLAAMMLPPQVTMIPLFTLFGALGWYDSLRPLWVPSFLAAGPLSAFLIFLMRQFFLSLPQDLEDAAKLDGCGPLAILWHVWLPELKPVLATVIVFTFVSAWNDFLGPLIYLNSVEHYPLSLGLAFFRQTQGGHWGGLLAVATLMTLPVVVLFFAAQRAFIRGITLSGLKG